MTKAWAVKGSDGEIYLKTVHETQDGAWSMLLYPEQRKREGYTCVPVEIREAGTDEAVAWAVEITVAGTTDWDSLWSIRDMANQHLLSRLQHEELGPDIENSRVVPLYAAPAVPEGWQPIDTAPKDGNTVLVGRFMGETWGFVYGAGYYFNLKGVEGWVCRGLRDPPGELGLGNPTYWMPLPAAPAARGEPK